MSTDIDGLNPRTETEKGRFFASGTRYMNPLAKFLEDTENQRACRLGTDLVYEDYDLWYANNGSALNDEDCLRLAKIVREALNTGQAAKWATENGHLWRLNQYGNAVYHIGSQCSLFSEECVAHFAEFLENCGGFEVS